MHPDDNLTQVLNVPRTVVMFRQWSCFGAAALGARRSVCTESAARLVRAGDGRLLCCRVMNAAERTTVGQRRRAARRSAGFSQLSLAVRAGVNMQTVSQ